ncbi:MAG: hypothetical protein ABI343_10135 [Burkholderiaceae bacterium]
MTQRVAIGSEARYVVRVEVRTAQPADIGVQVCERHLLYDWNCQGALLRARGLPGQWQSLAAPLRGDRLGEGPWYAPRLGMLTVSILDAGVAADFRRIGLGTSVKPELLANGDFSAGLAHWFPAAQYYFLPWHADSLYLETLIERGVAGLLLLLGLLAWSLLRLLSTKGRKMRLAPYLAASLFGAALIGGVSSFMDVPRVAYLFYLMLFFALQVRLPLPDSVSPGAAKNAFERH